MARHPTRSRLATALLTAVCLVAAAAAEGPEDGQLRAAEQVEPGQEEWLRQQLRKLETWRVNQLLRTEQKVDREQKRRANTSTSPLELSILADDEDAGVRFYVASNRDTPLATRIHLAGDSEAVVRSGVAMSLRFDPAASAASRSAVEGLAAGLATDANVLVRLTLVENRQLPPSVFAALAQDADFMVRRKVAQNPDTPGPVLAALAADSADAVVRAAALRHRNLPTRVLHQMAADTSAAVRRAVLANLNAPVDLLDSLAADRDLSVRRLTAAHPNTQLATLQRLTRDGDIEVVLAVARHPRADRSLLTQLAYDPRDPRVRLTAQGRLEPMLRREIRDDILERWKGQ